MTTSDESLKKLADIMGVLGVESRLRIITLLRDCGSLCVNALACKLNISQSAVSQHLRILHFNGLVTSHRDGYYTHYHLNTEELDSSIELLSKLAVRVEPADAGKCNSEGVKQCAIKKKANARNRKI